MDINKIGFLAFLSPLVLCFQQVRAYFASAFSFLIKSETIKYDFTGSYDFGSYYRSIFLNYLMTTTKSKFIPFGNNRYLCGSMFDRRKKKYSYEMFRFNDKVIVLYNNWFPILVTPNSFIYFNLGYVMKPLIKNFCDFYRDYSEKKSYRTFTIKECRGSALKNQKSETPSPSNTETTYYRNDDSIPGCQIYWHNLSISPPCSLDGDQISHSSKFDDIEGRHFFFSKEIKKLEKDIEFWLDSKDWYSERDMPWRRSTLLYGVPGTGKSSAVLNIAKKHQISIKILDISTMDNGEFCSYIDGGDSIQIILIEDVDRVFKGEINVNRTDNFGGLTFDCLLNKLSGVNAVKNAYIVLTANNRDELSDALLRDGRVDNHIEIGYLCREGKEYIAKRLLGEWPDLVELMVTDEQTTVAQFENECVKLAIQKHWERKNVEISD